MNTRNLKIEAAGDFWRKKVSPKIRLSGQWLEQAGFKPGHRVTVEISQPGTITLRFLDQSTGANDGEHVRGLQVDHLLPAGKVDFPDTTTTQNPA